MNIPEHIAIIMDGNRRWAKQKTLPIKLGHKNGAEALRKMDNTQVVQVDGPQEVLAYLQNNIYFFVIMPFFSLYPFIL